MDTDSRVVLNVGGIRHETYNHVLKKIPATRLSRLSVNLTNYDPILNEYFFDRHPEAFESILNYYRTGKLHYPTDICGPLFEEELDYWGIDSNQVEPCCWMTYTLFRDTQETLQIVDRMDLEKRVVSFTEEENAKRFGWENDFYNGTMSFWQKLKPKMWSLFNETNTSPLAKVTSTISAILVFASIGTFAGKTMEFARVPQLYSNSDTSKISLLPGLEAVDGAKYPALVFKDSSSFVGAVFYIDLVCNAWFSFEMLNRILFCPNLAKFIRSPINLIEVVAISSFVVEFLLEQVMKLGFFTVLDTDNTRDVIEFFAIARILRLFSIAQYYTPFKILTETFRASWRVLLLILFFIILFVVLFSSSVYVAERLVHNPENSFSNVFKGMWWALVALCSVGYGDVIPVTFAGKIVGCFVALGSVLATAFPVPVIVTNFTNLYVHMRARNKLPKERRLVLQLHELNPSAAASSSNGAGNPTFKTIRSTAQQLGQPRDPSVLNA
uniref:BTB domain-containing protein n=1 Tax=Plectus sambesii TaxID=2011161 RepID=A0A914UM60_9BILA